MLVMELRIARIAAGVVAALVMCLATSFGGCCSSNQRTLKEYRGARTDYEHYEVFAKLAATSTNHEGDWIRSSPYTLHVSFRGDEGDEGSVTLTGVKLYSGDEVAHQFETTETIEFRPSSSGSIASFTFAPLEIPHRPYRLELDFEATTRGVTKTGAVEIKMESEYKQFSGNNYFDALMGV